MVIAQGNSLPLSEKVVELNLGYCLPECGRCCRYVPVKEDDIENMVRHYGMEPDEFAEAVHLKDGTDITMLKQDDWHCMFLDERQLCSIYEMRPKVCEDYIGIWPGFSEYTRPIMYACYAAVSNVIDQECGVNLSAIMKQVWQDFRNHENYSRSIWLERADLTFDVVAN